MNMTRNQDRRKQTYHWLFQVIPLLIGGAVAWYGLRERVSANEIRIDSLPERMAQVETRVSVVEAQQEQAAEMLREIRGDIKTLIRHEASE
jgi:hypothetical protein